MQDLGTQSPWFSREFIEAAKANMTAPELFRRFNLFGEEVPYVETEETICPHCGHSSNSLRLFKP